MAYRVAKFRQPNAQFNVKALHSTSKTREIKLQVSPRYLAIRSKVGFKLPIRPNSCTELMSSDVKNALLSKNRENSLEFSASLDRQRLKLILSLFRGLLLWQASCSAGQR